MIAECVLEEEFDCQDERCIKKELECNGIENCRFRWDEDDHCLVSRLPVQLPELKTLQSGLRIP
jgi:hypothetical protein